MRSQAQYTIYSLNDVVTSATAPTPAYIGQLWVDTSQSPPVTMVWNGSAWTEQNGTDTIRTTIKTIETKEATLETNLNGLKSTVTSISKTVETIESDTAEAQENILALQTDVSELEQTASSIALRVTQNETNISSLTVSHNKVAARVTTAEGNITTLTADVSGLTTRVTNAEGDITDLEQTASSLTTRITSAEGNISTLTQTATSLTTRITTAEGAITTHTTDISGLKTRVSTAEGDITALEQTATSLTTRVTNVEGDITTLEQTATSLTTRVGTAESDISTLEQTTSTLSATVATKADQSGGATTSFGWSLTSSGFYLYSNSSTVMSVTSSGLSITGSITASSGTIGGFTIGSSAIYKTKTSYSSSTAGVYIGTTGIGLGAGTFYVTSAGYLKSTSGNIGGFTISSSAIYKTKTSYSSSTAGVYLGTTGIGLGAGTFYVTSAGYLYATNANITGTIYASSGSFENCDIGETCYIYGYLYCSGSEEVKFYGSKQAVTYETYMGGNGIASEIASTVSGTTHYSYSYVRPMGSIIVPYDYSTYANDGMIFGVMQAYTYRTQNILTGVSFYYGNDGTNISAEAFYRCADATYLDAVYTSSYGGEIMWGGTHFTSYMYGNWYVGASYGYLGEVYVSSTTYACLYGTWYVGTALWFGSSTTGYQLKIDRDQVSFYYNSSLIGDIETYSSYVDIQGTFKTNGNGWISSSDRKVKNTISDFDEKYEVLFDNLRPRTFKFNQGTSDRVHSGFIAQEIADAVSIAGLSTQDFAAVVAFGDATDERTEWGVRYEEIISLNTWEIQKLKARVAELEKIIIKTEE